MTVHATQKSLKSYSTKPFGILLLLYFSSGVPLALTGGTIAAWLSDSHVDIGTIGLFSVVAIPYSLKFLWSPFIDALPAPLLSKKLGFRRGWILATQILLALALLFLACARPDINPFITALAALLVAFFSASQDIVIDAYRVELLSESEQGAGAAIAQLGYRIGMIVSSAGALHLATAYGWQATYVIMSALLGIGMLAILFAKEPSRTLDVNAEEFYTTTPLEGVSVSEGGNTLHLPPYNIKSLLSPFIDFMTRPHWLLIIAFVITYKFADAFIGIVTNPFLLSIGFVKNDIANIVKIYGTIATLVGTFAGGALVMRFGAVRIMFVAGFLHAITNLLYAYQAHVGADTTVLAVTTAIENVSGGISSAAFVAYLSNLCNRHYTATQYALLSSLAAMARTWLSTPAGFAAKYFGWEWFFILAATLAAPGLLLLWCLQKRIRP